MTNRPRIFAALLAMGAMSFMLSSASSQTPATAPQPYSGPLVAVTYLEYANGRTDAARRALAQVPQTMAGTADLVEVGALAEISAPWRFVVVDSWKSAQAQATHAASASSLAKADWKGQGALAPADIRLHKPYDVAPAKPAGDGAIYVVTHVDVPPPSLAALEAILKPLAEKSRQETASLRFDLLQTTTRPNHFTVIETWSSQAGFDAHSTAAHVVEFREKLHPLLGALYDQRVFKALR